MVEPRFFHADQLDDVLDNADYVRFIIYAVEEIDDNTEYYKILAGRFYWEGEVSTKSKIYHRLIEVLSRKGVKVIGVLDLNKLAQKF